PPRIAPCAPGIQWHAGSEHRAFGMDRPCLDGRCAATPTSDGQVTQPASIPQHPARNILPATSWRSGVDPRQVLRAASGARDAPWRYHGIDLAEVVRAQGHLGSGRVRLEVLAPACSWNGDDVLALVEHPRECELRRGDVVPTRDLLEVAHELHVAFEVLVLPAGNATPPVIRGDAVEALERAGEQATTERAISDKTDPELPCRREDCRFRLAAEQRVLGLQRSDRMDCVCAPDRLRCGLRESDVADQSRGHQLSHRTDGFLDRCRGVDPVQVIEIDVVGAEAREALLERGADLVVPAESRATTTAELGGEYHVGPTPGDRPADHPLAVAGAVDVGGVDERDSQLEGTGDRRCGVLVVGPAIDSGEAHRAESDCRDHGALRAKTAMLHGDPPGLPSTRSQASALVRNVVRATPASCAWSSRSTPLHTRGGRGDPPRAVPAP